jgi:hypothetical protein
MLDSRNPSLRELNRLRKKGEWRANFLFQHTAGAKALFYFQLLAARLKSCPDTSRLNLKFFRSL